MGLRKRLKKIAKVALNPVAQVKQSVKLTKKTVSVVAQNKLLRGAVGIVATVYGGPALGAALTKGMAGYAAKKEQQAMLFPSIPDYESPEIQEQIAEGNAPEVFASAAAVEQQQRQPVQRGGGSLFSLFARLFGRR